MGGCRSQSCHGYLHALLEARFSHWNHHPLSQAPSPSSSIGDEFNSNLSELDSATELEIQYCANVMRTNFDEFRCKASKTFEKSDISNQTNFLRIFEAAIVLPFAKNCANPRKVGRNFERHFADSSKFLQLNSKRASKFRRLFRKVLKKFEDCFEISKCL